MSVHGVRLVKLPSADQGRARRHVAANRRTPFGQPSRGGPRSVAARLPLGIKRLDDIDREVLRELVERTVRVDRGADQANARTSR
jgi:hypothetical protein